MDESGWRTDERADSIRCATRFGTSGRSFPCPCTCNLSRLRVFNLVSLSSQFVFKLFVSIFIWTNFVSYWFETFSDIILFPDIGKFFENLVSQEGSKKERKRRGGKKENFLSRIIIEFSLSKTELQNRYLKKKEENTRAEIFHPNCSTIKIIENYIWLLFLFFRWIYDLWYFINNDCYTMRYINVFLFSSFLIITSLQCESWKKFASFDY